MRPKRWSSEQTGSSHVSLKPILALSSDSATSKIRRKIILSSFSRMLVCNCYQHDHLGMCPFLHHTTISDPSSSSYLTLPSAQRHGGVKIIKKNYTQRSNLSSEHFERNSKSLRTLPTFLLLLCRYLGWKRAARAVFSSNSLLSLLLILVFVLLVSLSLLLLSFFFS